MRNLDTILSIFAASFVGTNGFVTSSQPAISSSNCLQESRSYHLQTNKLRKTPLLDLEAIRNFHQLEESTNVDSFAQIPRRPYGTFFTSIYRVFIILVSAFIMRVINKTYLHDPGNNLKYLFDREDDVGILTISNHQSVMDDPGIWSGIIPARKLRLSALRTILVSQEWFYALGSFSANILFGLNCLPIHRADLRGLERIPALKEMHRRLNGLPLPTSTGGTRSLLKRTKKEWVHIMIEGRLYQSWRFPEDQPKLGRFRRGAAKVIASSPPSKTLVLPIYHRGMDIIFPERKPDGWKEGSFLPGITKSFFPRVANRVDVYIGDIVDFKDLIPDAGYRFGDKNDAEILNKINARLLDSMLKLESKASVATLLL